MNMIGRFRKTYNNIRGDFMKNEARLKYYVYNSSLCPVENDEGFDNASDPSIYEVIRVIDGVALFMEDHILRMRKSSEILGYTIHKTNKEIEENIYKLITENETYNMNIKLLCSNLDKKEQTFLAYFIKSSYPEKETYQKGIHTILYSSERKNPNAKVINTDFRQRVNDEIKKQGAYEALLVNEQGNITEGSRSNMFFVKGDKVYTAPAGEVLLGITRNEIMKACKVRQIEVIERDIKVVELKEFDGAFMTGTSVNALPITTINDIEYDSVNNKVINTISKEFLYNIKQYIENRKNCTK